MKLAVIGIVAATAAFAATAWFGSPANGGALALSLPVQCTVGRDCFIQNFVDLDPSSASKDFMCGSRTYDDHDGTDFRLLSMEHQRRGVAVLAAAPGRVLRLRDGVPDVSVRERSSGVVSGQECGNGVVIGHGDGWETQYCHMASGSIAVSTGQTLEAGAPLGKVGMSGNTEYPHLHFTVRKNGMTVEPFAPAASAGTCGTNVSDDGLWTRSAGLTDAYKAGEILNSGFAAGPVSMADVMERGSEQVPRPTLSAPALVAFVQAIGLQAGDVQKLQVLGPNGQVIAENAAEPLNANKAQVLLFAGRKRPQTGWPRGTYTARYSATRAGRVVLQSRFTKNL